MIRYSILTLLVVFLCMYSFKDWYKVLCWSLPLIAILERPDMPRAMLGLPGLNPYNVILFFVCLGWLHQKTSEGLKWVVPAPVSFFLKLYLLIVVISFLRMLLDFDGLDANSEHFNIPLLTVGELVKDDLFNAWKWLIPGMLLCHGAVTKDREQLAIQCILITGLLLAIQIFLRMWPALVGLDDLHRRGMRVFDRDIGYHGTLLAPFMASCAWGCVMYAAFSIKKNRVLLGYGGFALCSIALMATGGRGGALAWVACAIVFGLLRWKKIIIWGPVCVFVGLLIIPGAKERYLSGFTEDTYQSGIAERLDTVDAQGHDLYAMTSGRVIVWPRVVEKIREAPFFGFGMRAYQRQGVIRSLHDDGTLPMGAAFHTHPHNAYLMFILDTGLFGVGILLVFFMMLATRAVKNFRRRDGELYSIYIAGLLLAFLVVEMANGMSSGTFYPHQGNVLFWCIVGLFMRSIGGYPSSCTERALVVWQRPNG